MADPCKAPVSSVVRKTKQQKTCPLSAARRWVFNQPHIRIISASCYLHCPWFDTNFRIILPRLTGPLGWGLRARPGQQRPRSVAGAGWECQSRPVCLCKPPSHRRQRLTGVSCHSSVSRLRRMQQAAKAALQPSQPSSSDEPSESVGPSKGHMHGSKDAIWSWSEIFFVLRSCRLKKTPKKLNTFVVACSSNATHFLKGVSWPLPPFAPQAGVGSLTTSSLSVAVCLERLLCVFGL